MKRQTAIAAVIVGLLALAGPAWADDKEEAEKHFEAGVALQKVEDFAAAIPAFEASLRLHPTRGHGVRSQMYCRLCEQSRSFH